MTDRPLQIVILAAGKGTRMKSARSKVLHHVAGRSMLAHVLALASQAGTPAPAVVIGPDMGDVQAEALSLAPGAQIFVQRQQRGTADAVLAARDAIAGSNGDVLVLYADTPLIEADTLGRMRQTLGAGADVAVLGFEARDPTGYGRLITDEAGALSAIREHKDASPGERAIRLCNSGVMGFSAGKLPALLERIGNDNQAGEFYLTDAIAIARADGLSAAAIVCDEDEVLGVNSRIELAAAEAIYQRRARGRAMAQGATMISPETVWLSFDTVLGRDVVIEPNVFFGPGVTVADGALIRANSHIEGALIGSGARIGPFARLRPGARLGPNVHVGNFVEVKNAALHDGAKANHLSYIGDGEIGAGANIGAGTIFCNYDGFNKARTQIGAGAFIGSNSSLVAPVKIGNGAYVGSGSVITKDVAADALALARGKQEERAGWALKFRTMMQRRKQGAKAGG